MENGRTAPAARICSPLVGRGLSTPFSGHSLVMVTVKQNSAAA